MLKEKAGQYYFVQDKSCAEAILLAANEAYHLGMTEEATKLFAGFRTGMGMGGTCGALSGAIGVLSSKYGTREDLKIICADFVAAFEQKLALGTTECAPLAAKYKTEGKRCRDAVELTAEALEEFIDKLEGKAPAEGCTLRSEDIKRVKGMGFLQHKGTNLFNARVITRNGRILVELHRRLLFFHGVLLLGVFLVELVHLRFYQAHLRHRDVTLVRKRRDDEFHQDHQDQDDDAEAGDIIAQEVEDRDDAPAVHPAEDTPSQRDQALHVQFLTVRSGDLLEDGVFVRAEIECKVIPFGLHRIGHGHLRRKTLQ